MPGESTRRNPRDHRALRYCRWCATPFLIKQSRLAAGKGTYCSPTCRHKGMTGLLVDRMRDGLDVSGGPDACWPWLGATGVGGYGKVTLGVFARKIVSDSTHRVMWRLIRGPIPAGLFVLHACDNPPCCNPRHLSLGTARDNSWDKVRKGRHSRGFSNEQVWEIRTRYAAGETSGDLARAYGVGVQTIGHVVTRRSYKYI